MRADPFSADRFSIAAHEFRLPLSHIKGFVSTLRRRDLRLDEATRRDFLAEIEREADRLSEMIDDLLERSHSARERSRHFQRSARAPAALVAGGLDRVRGLLAGRFIEVDVPSDLPLVEVDGSAIERVIANLLQNALKYAQPTSHIRVRGRACGDALELRVEDDGPGIPARQRKRIFAPSYRGRRAQSSGQPGIGLGLAICLSIVSAHGGRIWADARPGGGARFTIVLPLRTERPLTEPSRPIRSSHNGNTPVGAVRCSQFG
jgi:two-component system sensor histidine kinase KdpD